MKKGSESPRIIIIAGPNGAGKTTFAREFLPNEAGCFDFINVDLIAAGLSPFAPEKASIRAGKLLLAEISRQVAARENFAFETTLSAANYSRQIPGWKAAGYRVKLVYLSLPSVELAVARVAVRVSQGGHPVPEEVIRRRYERSLEMFENVYKSCVDSWVFFDNSGPSPCLLSAGGR